MAKYKKSLFLFHRDLRLADNTGLIQALKQSEEVVPLFVFDLRQISENPYKSENALQFMVESLQDLQSKLKKERSQLYLFFGRTDEVISKLISKEKIEAFFTNKDYTPFSQKRDEQIRKVCKKKKIDFLSFDDYLLQEPDLIKTNQGQPYKVYSAFYNKAVEFPVKKVQKNNYKNYYNEKISNNLRENWQAKILKSINQNLAQTGGRQQALKILKKAGDFWDYEKNRNYPALEATTRLSAHNKFGTVSIREVYWQIVKKLSADHVLIKELLWRDFFTGLAYHYPHVFGQAFNKKYNKLKWQTNKKVFNSWKQGKTGFPIVDAGMRQLNQTGFMHNRVRMITASFLVKDLHIDWRQGEKYFAQNLVDYDPCVNNGNWQWAASTGADAQPYFRIFNPWTQQQKYDPQCKYIKKWLPELKSVDNKEIHNWFKSKVELKDYTKPIVDHKQESQKAKMIYKDLA